MILQLKLPLAWNHQPTSTIFQPACALSKQGYRLLTSLDAASGDPTASRRLIHKFVASSSKSVALNTLTHLLSSNVHRHSSLALPMYERITQACWFNWNPRLVANVIASLEKQGCSEEAEILISESIQRLGFRERDVALFYCDLIDSFSKNGSKESVTDYCTRLKQIMCTPSSSNSSLKRKAYESMIAALCTIDLPREAEEVMGDRRNEGLNSSGFEFRSIVLAYGRLGLFSEMRRVLDQMEKLGHNFDTICFNMVLSSYGIHGELSQMVSWIQKMKSSNTPFTIRTYNTVLNSCPTIISLLQDPNSLPLSLQELVETLPADEALLIGELIESAVLREILEWNLLQGKLDLHGMHLGAVYVIMLQWIEELRSRLCDGNSIIPAEIRLVCGLGKHSKVRGDSPVKGLVSEMMVRLHSPMRSERNNVGCFFAKGKNVRNWLS